MKIKNWKLKIVFFGTPSSVMPIIEALQKNFEVVAVVTAPDQKSGRKQLLTPSPVKVYAQKHNIPVLQPKENNSLKSLIVNLKSDLFIVAAYGKIIPKEILVIPQYGAINIHPSLLPKYRGPTPIQTTILNGDKTSGITFIKMDEQMDHGPILHQIPFTLEETDTFDELMQSTFAQAAQSLPDIIEEYVSGKIKPKPQDNSKTTYTKIITKQDGYIDLSLLEKFSGEATARFAGEIARKIRAYYPWPTVWTRLHLSASDGQAKLIKFLPGGRIQVEGKKPVSIKDFLNGYPELREQIEKLF